MASEAPPFWWEKPDWRAVALSPVSAIYGAVAASRMRRAKRERVDAPVLCVGNFTVGGTGKTPTVIALAHAAAEKGMKPGILSRGHGGSFTQPHIVEAATDNAGVVGDEPLLLARHAPVAVTPRRAEGARLLLRNGCDFLIMDDGFQSARIHIDYALAVIDARHGIGNGHIIPGGPLRAPLLEQLRHADALLRMGEGAAADPVIRMAARAGKPIYEAGAVPVDPQAVAGRRFLAFAGIGHPDRFFDMVAAAGGHLSLTRSFPDHHVFAREELTELFTAAKDAELELITTEKDAARLRKDTAPEGFLERITVFKVETKFENASVPGDMINKALAAWRKRRVEV